MPWIITVLVAVVLTSCGYGTSTPTPMPQLRGSIGCLIGHRGDMNVLCCPEASGKQRCFITTGGFDI